ncbi:MAG: hypothetical protein WB974_04360 [Acidobacteriaceae bacterium]
MVISALSFVLILWIAAWLPHVLFTGWMRLSPRTRSMAMPVYLPAYLMVVGGASAMAASRQRRRRRAQRWNAVRPRRAH